MRKGRILAALAMAVLSLVATAARADIDNPTMVTGKVTVIDVPGNTFTVVTPSGKTMVITSNDQSMYMARGTTVRLVDLKVGDPVTVTYTGDPILATRVDIDRDTPTVRTTYTETAENRLPRTGSSLPLLALAGIVLLGAAFGVRLVLRSN